MAFEVIFKKRFINNLVKVQLYLEKEWGEKIATQFLKKIDNRINMLKAYPNSGIRSEKIPGVRGLLITKHNIMFYRIDGNKIVILNLYDTRSNPAKRTF
jgi:plasmid stabilization system protein ParE